MYTTRVVIKRSSSLRKHSVKRRLPVIIDDQVASVNPQPEEDGMGMRGTMNRRRGVTVARTFTLIGKRVTSTLFDTGASPSVIRSDVWQEVKEAESTDTMGSQGNGDVVEHAKWH